MRTTPLEDKALPWLLGGLVTVLAILLGYMGQDVLNDLKGFRTEHATIRASASFLEQQNKDVVRRLERIEGKMDAYFERHLR